MDINQNRKEYNREEVRVFKHHSGFSKKMLWVFFLVILVLCFYFGQSVWMYFATSGYQAVFLDNGQVYFGKLSASPKWLKLSDIYYLQTSKGLQQTSDGVNDINQNIQLVKLGSELHGPDDSMYILHDKVLFWENLKSDSKVVDAINKYKTK